MRIFNSICSAAVIVSIIALSVALATTSPIPRQFIPVNGPGEKIVTADPREMDPLPPNPALWQPRVPGPYYWGQRNYGPTFPPSPPYCQAAYGYCTPGAVASQPVANNSDVIDVFYSKAPVFEVKYGNLFKNFDLFHVGLGFIDRTNGESYQVEFDAIFEVLNASFPFVLLNSSGILDLTWCDEGAFCVTAPYNASYWTVSQQLITTINGSQFNALMNWLPSANNTWTQYQFWNVFNKFPSPPPFVDSITCADVAFYVIQELANLGAQFNCSQICSKDYMNFYGSTPTPVDPTDQTTWQNIVKYYQEFQFKNQTMEDILIHILTSFFGEEYIYYGGSYFQLHFGWPFFGYEFYPQALPGCSASKRMLKSASSKKNN